MYGIICYLHVLGTYALVCPNLHLTYDTYNNLCCNTPALFGEKITCLDTFSDTLQLDPEKHGTHFASYFHKDTISMKSPVGHPVFKK